jgi:hypothetical protein
MEGFRELAKQPRLVAAIYFAWDSDPWSKTADPLSIDR